MWWSDWGNRALVGLGLYVALYIAWMTFEWGGQEVTGLVTDIGFVPVSLLGFVFTTRAIRRLSGDWQSQKAWGLIGVGLLIYFVSNGLWITFAGGERASPSPTVPYGFYILSMMFVLIGVTRFPTGPISRWKHFRYWVDALIILSGTILITSYLVVGQAALIDGAGLTKSGWLLVYPIIDQAVIVTVLLTMLRHPRRGKIGILSLLAAGAILISAGNLWWVYIESRGIEGFRTPIYALWIAGFAMMIAGPQRHVDAIQRQLPLTYPGKRTEQITVLFPYVAATVAFIIFLFAAVPVLANQLGVLVGLVAVGILLLVVRLFLTLRENTQYQIEQVRQASEARIHALVEYSSDLISVLDSDLRFRFQSPSSRQLIGLPPNTFIDTPILDWAHEDDRPLIVDAIQGMIMNGHHEARFEWRLIGLHMRVAELETIASNELETPGVNGIVLNSRDVSERKQHERELGFRANHDSLTGLPNRASFVTLLDLHLSTVREHGNLGVMFIDLDRFKAVNDSLGHDAGDDLLIQVAQRMRASVRSQDIISRFAGDEFTVLLPDIDSTDELKAIAERIRQTIDQPFTVAGTEVLVSSSIGVTTTSISDQTAENLIRDADVAMYIAKHHGRDRSILFHTEMFDEQVPSNDN